jgi:hypothetical protein
MTNPGMLPRPTDLDGFRCAEAFRMSESETGDIDRDPKDEEEAGGHSWRGIIIY